MRGCHPIAVVAWTGILLLFSGPVVAQQADTSSGRRMTRSDLVRAALSTAAISGDWLTTLHNVRRSQQPGWSGHEINPILGPHPSISRVNTVFVAATVTNLAVGTALSHKARDVFWSVVTVIESVAILINVSQY